MGKGIFISRALTVTCVVVTIAAAITIIALLVLYAQERSKNEGRPPSTDGPSTSPLSLSTTPSTPKEPWEQYRLPDSLAPISYDVTLWPRLTPQGDNLYIFTGNSTVVFRCVRETDLILLHSHQLNLTSIGGHQATLRGRNGAIAPGLKQTWLMVSTQYLVVQLDDSLQPGSTYELFTDFVGELSDNPEGFYRSEYEEDGEKKYEFDSVCLRVVARPGPFVSSSALMFRDTLPQLYKLVSNSH